MYTYVLFEAFFFIFRNKKEKTVIRASYRRCGVVEPLGYNHPDTTLKTPRGRYLVRRSLSDITAERKQEDGTDKKIYLEREECMPGRDRYRL